MARTGRILAAVAGAAGVALATWLIRGERTAPDGEAASYVGREVCASCHEGEAALWRGSHHDLAMQEAVGEAVLGDFDDATFTHRGTTTRFHRVDGRPHVETEGPDGSPTDYEVAYTFGADPLQQYLIPFPGGRYQMLGIAWDSRPAEEGGQRWFHLYPELDSGPESPFHWTRPLQNWNAGCAACHSTGLVEGFDVASDSFHTTWSEIDVSCEACHGPGSRHVRLAERGEGGPGAWGLIVPLSDPTRLWTLEPGAPVAVRTEPLGSRVEVETCAACHSRRTVIDRNPLPGSPLLDGFVPTLLRGDLYYPDGQIMDEVYVYGSFVQSRMYAAGVTCSDCHEPHRLTVRAEGNDLCTRCHQAARYDAPSHHFHEEGSTGARCVECHMPETTYMVVDPRRDHSLRIPRPDLTLSIGVPNACNRCHTERSADWAAEAVAAWYGPPDAGPTPGEVIHAARTGDPAVASELAALTADRSRPGILRATALSLLSAYPRAGSREALGRGVADPDPLVRLGALRGMETLSPQAIAPLAFPLLSDTVRAVRIEAARLLAPVPPSAAGPDRTAAIETGLEEYERAKEVTAAHPASWVDLGSVYALRGRTADAERAYRRALSVDSADLAAHLNLADLQRAMGRDDLAEETLEEGLTLRPEAPELLHALGLLRVRQGDLGAALELLRGAAEGRPDSPRFAYVYGVARASSDGPAAGVEVLQTALRRHPFDPDLLSALATYSRDLGDSASAVAYARRLVEVLPEDPGARELLEELRGPG